MTAIRTSLWGHEANLKRRLEALALADYRRVLGRTILATALFGPDDWTVDTSGTPVTVLPMDTSTNGLIRWMGEGWLDPYWDVSVPGPTVTASTGEVFKVPDSVWIYGPSYNLEGPLSTHTEKATWPDGSPLLAPSLRLLLDPPRGDVLRSFRRIAMTLLGGLRARGPRETRRLHADPEKIRRLLDGAIATIGTWDWTGTRRLVGEAWALEASLEGGTWWADMLAVIIDLAEAATHRRERWSRKVVLTHDAFVVAAGHMADDGVCDRGQDGCLDGLVERTLRACGSGG